MRVEEIMTRNPVCCTPDAKLQEVALKMMEQDCGAIPIVDQPNGRPVGIVTDRDIVCQTVAEGKNPLQVTAKDVMSSPCVTVTAESSLEDCCGLLEGNQIRRLVVVDKQGKCCGIVAQADIARHAPESETGEVVKEVSQPAK
jgi:CBS domain-containing protein